MRNTNSYIIKEAEASDLEDILKLQKEAFQDEAKIYGACSVPPLSQTLEDIKEEFKKKFFLKVMDGNTIIGSVRVAANCGVCIIEKLIVSQAYQNRGIGYNLMIEVEKRFPNAERFELFTGGKSEKNLYLYKKAGYKIISRERKTDSLEFVFMAKENKKSE